ncbi:alanyl-tRNA editing protein [Xenorhabdus sp. XENO-2]|uniref:Alanyl-tRNA editing protein n=2 Tax=Xenorhabdus anantnagensis TaxID=3025875 RepID=A0ABT5LQB0_9GAMM|nr:alanyl-tRNA editing protein [Xenorhabdus anantnagensis]
MMLQTKRLFDDAPYDCTFNANVIEVGEDYIVLDKTLFYPLSGNQNYDTGEINGVIVTAVSVEEKQNESNKLSFTSPIKHYVDTSEFEVGQQVIASINEENRLRTMRLHSASHVVEYFIRHMSSFLSVEGSFVNMEKDRTDYKMSESVTAELLASLEEQVNNFISQENEITFTAEDGLRYWQCRNIKMLCCGTHVSNTKEIGKVKLSRKNKGKGINRIEITLVD